MDRLDRSPLRVGSVGFLIVFLSFAAAESIAREPEFDINDRIEETETPDNSQEGSLNTNNQNSNNNNKTVTNNGAGAGSPTPVATAIAPSLMSSGNDSCLKSRSTAAQLLTIGLSGGYYKQDEECNRRRDAKVFKDLGMSIAAVARMCQNRENWNAMFEAGTPCPILINGKMVFGKKAVLVMKTHPEIYIPDYDNKKDYYKVILGIGEKVNVQENTDDISVSERFRSSTSAGSSESN